MLEKLALSWAGVLGSIRVATGVVWVQLKFGQLLAMHAAGGPMSSNLPSSSPSKQPAALKAGGFGSILGSHGLLTFLRC